MNRRSLLIGGASIAALAGAATSAGAAARGKDNMEKPDTAKIPDYDKWRLSDAEWRQRLSPEAYAVLRKESTERAWTSPYNDEHRKGVFACAGCGYDLFSSEMKFDSGTGWPSFFDHLPNAIATKRDFRLILPRTEYHCARCGGHQGHVFEDGPKPTGLRYCNNGVALTFKPAQG
ncbi:MAG: peptide-methionine (R)-S-oxide reductase MsrB [Alphaproteobacteria bacterium]|nr:peptide-methionine (R)-S-oxide reductase MsrB [Alphaproteobacteria bacterium]